MKSCVILFHLSQHKNHLRSEYPFCIPYIPVSHLATLLVVAPTDTESQGLHKVILILPNNNSKSQAQL